MAQATRQANHYLRLTGQPTLEPSSPACPRYLARIRTAKAKQAKAHWQHHFDWPSWLPDKWARVAGCETGYGRRGGNWTWDSGTYVSAFGIYRPAYTQFAHTIGQRSWGETRSRLGRLPTPREQYNVALAIHRRFGFGGWGCRGA